MAIKAKVEQRIDDALATLARNHNTNFGIGAGGESSQENNQDASRSCNYKNFANYKPKMFYGNKGFIGLMRWIDNTESMSEISSCTEGRKVKFVACIVADTPMSWWNNHVKIMGLANAKVLYWEKLKKIPIEEYFPWEEMQRLE